MISFREKKKDYFKYIIQITCLLGPENIYLINIGDSRAIVFSHDGHILAYTEGK